MTTLPPPLGRVKAGKLVIEHADVYQRVTNTVAFGGLVSSERITKVTRSTSLDKWLRKVRDFTAARQQAASGPPVAAPPAPDGLSGVLRRW